MTEDQLKDAAELWAKGIKTQDIATAFGVTRTNMAYIAASHRKLFPARSATFYRASGFTAKHIENRAKLKAGIKEKWPEKAPLFMICEETGVETKWFHEGRTVHNLGCGCNFPLWGHHETFVPETSLYCGAERDGGHTYCSFHRIATTGLGTRSERDAIKMLKAAA
jgi:hypothetical protein